MSEFGGFCRCCLGVLLTLGFVALFLWLSYRPIKPRFYLTAFSLLPSPIVTDNLTALASFTLEIENKNKELGIDYDPISLSLSLNSTTTTNSSAAATIPGFYQGHQRTADKSGYFAGDGRTPAARAAKVSNGSAVFRVVVESAIRYKTFARKGRRHKISVAGEVAVDKEGKKTGKKGIRLQSAAPPVAFRSCGANLLLGFIVSLVLW
ncbi:protein NDR1-like [Typha latifolia]|uniref:protein NDR1-like n=1 Tax=Typha latifolia TaxID=4733 RepID=UPI003C2CB388